MRALVLALLAMGCRATPLAGRGGTSDLAPARTPDMQPPPRDLAVPTMDLAMCPRGVAEICDNGCDDDLNGYADGDDPACSTQLLVTVRLGTSNLARLVIEPVPHLEVLDGNPVNGEAFAVYDRAFSPAAYVALAGATKQVSVRPLDGGVANVNVGYSTRDACVFAGELLVVENNPGAGTAKLHRYPPGGPSANGANELAPAIALTGYVDACASDGSLLYVSRHDNSTAAGTFIVIDKTHAVVGAPIALPSGLPSGYNRCLDFAWTKRRGVFVGLFAKGSSVEDPTLDGQWMAPFGFDGGLGPAIDAGVWHGIGEFLP